MIVLAEGWPIDLSGAPRFSDVPSTDTFYQFIERAYNRGVISGYAGGTFRPNNNITRGQISKIIVLAEEWPLLNPPTPTFTDVLPGSTFYTFVETAVSHGIVTGYADRTFRPNNNATRAQLSKMLYLAIAGGEPTPTPSAGARVPMPATPTALPTVTPGKDD